MRNREVARSLLLSNSWLLCHSIRGKSTSPYSCWVVNQGALVSHGQGVVTSLKSSHIFSPDILICEWGDKTWKKQMEYPYSWATTQTSSSGNSAFGLCHFPGQLFSLPLDFVRISWSPSNKLFFFFLYSQFLFTSNQRTPNYIQLQARVTISFSKYLLYCQSTPHNLASVFSNSTSVWTT